MKLLACAALALYLATPALAQGARYRCVIASGGQMVYSKGGFRSKQQCYAFCGFNAQIRRLGGSYQITWDCPRGW